MRDGEHYLATIGAAGFRLDLTCARTQPVLLQGDAGFSRKGPESGQASHYYSVPHLAVAGRIGVGTSSTEVTGSAWLDHEWSSEIMGANAVGWDWAGINLDDGGALMAFAMRGRDGAPVWSAATLRDAAGSRTVFPPSAVQFTPRRMWRSPRTGASYPVAVDVRIGTRTFTLLPWFDDQEIDARASTGTVYWEGAVRASEADVAVGRWVSRAHRLRGTAVVLSQRASPCRPIAGSASRRAVPREACPLRGGGERSELRGFVIDLPQGRPKGGLPPSRRRRTK